MITLYNNTPSLGREDAGERKGLNEGEQIFVEEYDQAWLRQNGNIAVRPSSRAWTMYAIKYNTILG